MFDNQIGFWHCVLVATRELKMADMHLIHAQAVYDHAHKNWGVDGWDWIYETCTPAEMAQELASRNIKTKAAAIRYYKEWAKLMHEKENEY